jgi:DNA-binding MarR family transcriptional regulator
MEDHMIEDKKLDQFLTHWRFINRHLREGMMTHGEKQITRLQWTLLRHVGRTEDCTMGSLAKNFNVSLSTVSQMIDRLEKWGLVQRESSTSDARVKIVSLSEKGEKIIRDMKIMWVNQLANGLNKFSDDEQEVFIGFLERLAENLKEAPDQEQ